MLDVPPMNQTTEIDISALRKRLESREGPDFWRGLEELGDSPEFQEYLHKEFPRQAAPLESAVDRRGFLKILGASLALAGLTACVRPLSAAEKVVPYVRQPEEIIPGNPLFFASAIAAGGFAEGVLVESHQGRPTKLEGNPDHPASLGTTSAITQASILTLYDPERSQQVLHRGAASNWEAFVTTFVAVLAASGDGSGVHILTEPVRSPSLAGLMRRFLNEYPQAVWHQYDSLGHAGVQLGTELAFGQQLIPDYDLTNANVVVSFDADFTSDYPGRLRYANQLGARRRIREAGDNMGRLYVFESSPSGLGSIADHRVPASPAAIAELVTAVAAAVGVAVEAPAGTGGVDAVLVQAMVADLTANAGSSAVFAGPYLPPEVQALVHAINVALGNVGSTVSYREAPEAASLTATPLQDLVAAVDAGEVSTLLMIGTNPVHTAPAGIGFAQALGRIELTAHVGLYADETAQVADWHVPQAHYLETWGDARAYDGTATITQPLLNPFYGGRSDLEVMAALLGMGELSGYRLVSDYWRARVSGTFDSFWRESVYRGVVPGTQSPVVNVDTAAVAPPAAAATGLVVAFRPDPSVADGRWANNGWLQELPKPFTKLVWDNAALVSAATAEEYGLRNGDVVDITVGGRQLELPAWILPGQAAGVVTVHLGFGRSAAGRIGDNIGGNVNALRTAETDWNTTATMVRTGRRHQLVSTQLHSALEGTGERRHIVRHGTLTEFRADPAHPHFVHPVPHHEADLFPDYEYTSYKWGMVIDMNVCTGCNACVVACQSENNIPIVGKDQVAVGREMHWMRIDGYYGGSIDDPEYYHQPMLCQHCEKAPCEPVCPVGATVHDHEGLNVMVYNRCVGTRYCANNCPFKVRRFNFLQYAELSGTATELSMAANPDVTVRSRGVMEKCTYCTQRISKARIQAGNEGRTIRDGEVVTACQAACPTQAIVFGDLNDPGSAINSHRQSPLNYTLLEDLNVYPRNSYVARVRNPVTEAGAD